MGLLRNVHAYDQAGVTVGPVRGVAEVLGASVEYHAPKIVVRSSDQAATIEIEPGSSAARLNGRSVDMGGKARVYSGIACVPVRLLAEQLGARVEYQPDWRDNSYAFGSVPWIVIGTPDGDRVVLVHERPPDAVAKFVADMENTYQTNASPGAVGSFYVGTYGVDWIVRVAHLASDGRHFLSSSPEFWDEDSPLAPQPPDDGVPRRYIIGQGYVPPLPPRELLPGFWGNAAAIYGIRDGVWCHLIATQDVFALKACERIGIPRAIVRELTPYYSEDWAPFVSEGSSGEVPPPAPEPQPVAAEPQVTVFLTLESARAPVHVGRGYYVSNLNFVQAYDFSDRGAKVLGQVFTPVFDETSPIRIEMTLTAFDADLRVLGHASINFYSVPASGAMLPFEAMLLNVRLPDIACVSIVPKGAWVTRD